MKLTRAQQSAMYLLHEQERNGYVDGAVTSDRSLLLDGQAWIHWRVARSLEEQGLVEIEDWGPDGATLRLTPLGREEVPA